MRVTNFFIPFTILTVVFMIFIKSIAEAYRTDGSKQEDAKAQHDTKDARAQHDTKDARAQDDSRNINQWPTNIVDAAQRKLAADIAAAQHVAKGRSIASHRRGLTNPTEHKQIDNIPPTILENNPASVLQTPVNAAPVANTVPKTVEQPPANTVPVVNAAPANTVPVVNAAPANTVPVVNTAPANTVPVVNTAPANTAPAGPTPMNVD